MLCVFHAGRSRRARSKRKQSRQGWTGMLLGYHAQYSWLFFPFKPSPSHTRVDLMGCSSNTFLCLYPGSSWSIWSPRSDRRPWSCCKYKSPSKDSDNFALLGKQLRGSNPFGKMTCLSKQMLRKVNFLLVREVRVRCGVWKMSLVLFYGDCRMKELVKVCADVTLKGNDLGTNVE